MKQLRTQIEQMRREKMIRRANCDRLRNEIRKAQREQTEWQNKIEEKVSVYYCVRERESVCVCRCVSCCCCCCCR